MHRSGRFPLFSQLRRTFHKAQLANHGISPKPALSRRQFLSASAAGLLAAYTASTSRAAKPSKSPKPSVVVVGAGIAGLNATYLLSQAGYKVSLYEGSGHVGGRIQTDHGSVADNVYTELGGEFIDSDHDDMLSLAQLFGFSLIDTLAPSENGLEIAYFGGGRLRSEAEVIAAFQPLAAIVENDYNQTSDDITFDSHSNFDARLDRTDLRKYLTKNCKVDWLFEILEAAYVNEYGLDLENQSSINFVWTISTDTTDGFAIYGESDQRYKIKGGNQQIVDALGDSVANCLTFNHKLSALSQSPNGQYQVTFDRPKAPSTTLSADIVLLALPFSILRNINVTVPLPAIKTKAIQQLGYGINGKLILGFQSRLWRDEGFTGDSYAGLDYQSGWDSSRQQKSKQGAYTIYPGGTDASDLGLGTDQDQAKRLLPQLNQVFPGVQKQWLGTALRAYWPTNPFVLASYSAYLPGQWTGIRGAEPTPVGNLFFAGEHTSLNWQGYMNGGAESGRLAAQAIIG